MNILNLSFFGGRNVALEKETIERKSQYEINNPKLIYGKLVEIKKTITKIGSIDSGAIVISKIISIDSKNKSFSVDDLPESVISDFWRCGRLYVFSGVCDGVKFSFDAMLKDTLNLNTRVLTFNMPKKIEWMQRREFYRVRIPMSHKETYLELKASELGLPSIGLIKLPIIDLSVSGVAVSIGNSILADAKFNKKVNASICLHNSQYFDITLQFINDYGADYSDKSPEKKIGCRFVDASNQFQIAIQNYINYLQIEVLKNVKH